MKPIIQGPIDELSRRLTALEAEVARLRRSGVGGGLSTVVTDDTLSGNGSTASPLSAADLDGRLDALETGTGSADLMRFSYTAAGTEGTEATVTLPYPRTNTNYSIFMTNATTGSFVYHIPSGSKTTTNFKVVTTTALMSGEELDFLLVNHGGTADSISLSGTINARFINLTGSLISSITSLSGTVNSRFVDVTGSLISSVANLSGTIDSKVRYLPVSNIWDKPISPHSMDDEFESTTLDASWTVFSTSGAFTTGVDPYTVFASGPPKCDIHTRRRSWYMVQCPNDSFSYAIYKTGSLLPTDFFCWIRFNFTARLATTPVNNDNGILLGFFQTTSFSDCVLMSIDLDGGTFQTKFSKLSGGSTTLVGTGFDYFTTVFGQMPVEGLGIQKIGTNYYGWSFSSSGHAVYHGTVSWTGSLNQIMIRHANAGAGGVPNPIIGIDFIRFVTGSTFLP